MGCVIQDLGFTVNGQYLSGPTCTASKSDSIGFKADVNFDQASVGQLVFVWFDILWPDGSTKEFWGNNGVSIYVASAGVKSLIQNNIITSTDPVGLYQINSVYILGADKVSFVCSTTKPISSCTVLSLTEGGGITPTSGIPKPVIIAIAAVGLFGFVYLAAKAGRGGR